MSRRAGRPFGVPLGRVSLTWGPKSITRNGHHGIRDRPETQAKSQIPHHSRDQGGTQESPKEVGEKVGRQICAPVDGQPRGGDAEAPRQNQGQS
ncbi:MAG TPA: hypothetical protein VE224_13215 [Pseudolabrys sp.]|nr:hypothetical protein [Pseudolabrys sp.]